MRTELTLDTNDRRIARAAAHGNLDGRTRGARMLALIREDLIAALGHDPDPLEAEMIEIAAAAAMQIRIASARIISGDALAPDEIERLKQLHAVAAAALGALGIEGKPTVAGMSLKKGEA